MTDFTDVYADQIILKKGMYGVPRVPPTEGWQRWHDIAVAVASRTVAETYHITLEAEAAWEAVAISLQSNEAAASVNYKAVVGNADAFLNSGANRFVPVQNGVAQNVLRSGTAVCGWDAVTWAGAATTGLAGSPNLGAPAIAISDFMRLQSLPRADGGARPVLMIRVFHDGTINPHTVNQRAGLGTNFSTANANNRGRLMDFGFFAGDAIATLSSSVVAETARSFLVAPIFRYRPQVVSVAFVGDSITNGAGSLSGLDSWGRRACADLSTVNRPVIYINNGMPQQTTTTFLAQAKVALALQKPTVAFYTPYSPNNAIVASNNVLGFNRGLMDMQAQAAEFLAFCSAQNIVPVLATSVPNNNLSAADDALRVQCNDYVRRIGLAGSVLICDLDKVTSDQASPARYLAGLNADALHPNDAGYEKIASEARNVIRIAAGL